MKRFLIFFSALYMFITVYADEGLWLPMYLKKQGIIYQMRKKGLILSAEDIYNENNPSLKDAVVIFGTGCTGEFISPMGLILTNYHCGHSFIQRHSTPENDYLSSGFWAQNLSEELPNPGLTVKILVHAENVTEQILNGITENTPEYKRQNIIEQNKEQLLQQITKKYPKKYYYANVYSFYNGNMYMLMVYEVFRDVRLVGAPPSAIGRFGGDTDNWIWPRHTGDFSIFRVYADTNNMPAEYSPNNVPYKPKKFFKISLNGIKQGDFTMVMGYPGITYEYLPSFAIKQINNIYNSMRIKIREDKLNIINNAIKTNPTLRIMYSAKQARIANAWKKWIGAKQGLNRLKTIKKKQLQEKKFLLWIKKNKKLAKYKNILNDLKKYYNLTMPYKKAYYAFIECFYLSDWWNIYKSILNEQSAEKFYKKLNYLYKNYDTTIEKQLFIAAVKNYLHYAPKKFIPKTIVQKLNSLANDTIKYALEIFNSSMLTSMDKAQKLNFLPIEDPLIQLYNSLIKKLNEFEAKNQSYKYALDSLNRLYIKLLMQMDSNKIFYPDANFTLRVSFGSVKGYQPRDAVFYRYFTTLKGVIEKENPKIYDYKVPKKLKTLYEKKDFGKYYDKKDSTMHIAFIADNHTTGGNSGSPVIDKNGYLIGVNFDRVWEGTMSDYDFDTSMCRNITLDIRYVLFIIDKYANAKHLIKEMKIIN